MTRLCVPLLIEPGQIDAGRRDIAAAVEAGADVVELRLDYWQDADDFPRLVGGLDVPLILTCRPSWEGGHSELDDDDRLDLLERCFEDAPEGALIDYEWAAVERGVEPAAPFIVSSHDFTGRPPTLTKLYAQMADSEAAVVKLAWAARSVRDNLEAFDLLAGRAKPTIALCMGEAGLPSRVLAKKFGAFLSFAALRDDIQTAAGQPTIAQMKDLYRWDHLTPATEVFGVVGDPVGHSMSPAVHNAAFDATGHDGVYLPLPVAAGWESFKAFMETFGRHDALDLRGLSVTIPHKENALRHLRETGGQIEPLAGQIGAVNTLTFGETLAGRNTDHAAILASLNLEPAGKTVGVIGAGGTGRTAVAAVAAAGAAVTIYNRSEDRAAALAAEFGVQHAPLAALAGATANAWLNTTSLGMSPDTDASPFDGHLPKLTPETIVWDAVYNPPKTKLLQQAQAAGATAIGGIHMFTHQAAAQFEQWTGNPAPLDAMREAIEAKLRPTHDA
jgi:3-dehydroquinate dehydratase/shikimate dehydrogenase